MAITWGSYKADGSNAMRLGYEITQSPSSVGSGTSSVDLTLRVYFGTKYPVSDSTNTFTLSGNWGSASTSENISHGSSSAWSSSNVTLIHQVTIAVTPSYSGTVSRSFSASFTGISAIAGTVSVSGSKTVARRPYVVPDPPSNVNVVRSSDTGHTVTWTRNATTAGPYTNQIVERWDDVGGEYKRIAPSISGSATSYSDTTTVANRRYRYRLLASNSAGTSGSPESSASQYIYTSPAAPGTPTAKKSGTSIVVSWAKNAYDAATYEIQDYANGVAGSTFTAGAGATSYTHASPNNAQTHAYRVRAKMVDTGGAGTVYSAWSPLSNTIQLLAPPNAPTNLAPSGVALDATEPITLTWSHNPVDTTDQTAYGIQYRVNGGAWVIPATVASGVSERVMPAGTWANGVTVEWQVRTRGDHATYSPYSASGIFETSSRPGVSILAPTGTLLGSKITAEWSYFDAETSPQIGARVKLYNGATTDDLVGTANITGEATSHVLSTKALDGQTYTISVEVRDASGLWSLPALSTFTVDYAAPPTPEFSVQWNEDTGSAAITYVVPAPNPGEAEATHVEVWRSANGDEWKLVAGGLPLDSTIVDAIPATHGVNHYRVVSVSALPSTAESPTVGLAVPVNGWIYLNGGPGFGQVVRIGEDAAPDYTPGRARAMHTFAGREYPLEVTGESKSYGVSFSARFGPDSSTWDEWERLIDQPGPFCYRDPSQRMFVGGIQWSHNHQKMTRRMTFSAERTSFDE